MAEQAVSHVATVRDVGAVWGLSEGEIARLGLWPGRADDLTEATALLVAHLKPERIPWVVRQPAPRLGGRSLLDLALAGQPILQPTRDMFGWSASQA
jgi:hypothetical protein